MDKFIKTKFTNVLKATYREILNDNNLDNKTKTDRIGTLVNLKTMIEKYDTIKDKLEELKNDIER